MKKTIHNLLMLLVAAALLLPGTAAQSADPVDHAAWIDNLVEHGTWSEVSAWLKSAKDVIELADASIIIEANSTDGDAGFQVFFDGEGWRHARVFDPDGNRILLVTATGGVRRIGGGTELFMETSEPEYEDLDGMQELIELLPEGEYYFLARTTEGDWANGTAELTHDVPAGPEILQPLPPEEEDACSTGVFFDSAVIEWEPVETDIWGEEGIEVEGYQVIVEAEDADLEFMVVVPGDTTMVSVPEEALAPGMEFSFEILAIEESGNQTITEGCFETEEE